MKDQVAKREAMNVIMSRESAKTLGLLLYFDGKLCPLEHYSPRYTKSATCVVCSMERNRLRRHDSQIAQREKRVMLEERRANGENVKEID